MRELVTELSNLSQGDLPSPIIDVACRLARRDLDIKDFLARYLEIREHFYK
jgi:hypothetical protein